MRKAILLLTLVLLYGCDQSVETPIEPVAEVKPSQQGIVLETIDVETYTYMRLSMEGEEVWVASTPTEVAEGDIIRFYDSILMQGFRSEVLDRTFEEILFVSQVEVAGAHPINVTAPPAATAQDSAVTGTPAAQGTTEVERLEGGMTIAEIYSQSEQLEGQQVSLRARVTKFSANILGKNWITLQDGTGAAPDDSLVFTTTQTAAIGDQLVVTGMVKTNVDIGAGYNYKVLLEEAGPNP